MNLAVDNKHYISWQDSLIASIEAGIVVVNSDFVIEEWNQFMENHAGIEANKAIGESLFSCFDDLDKDWLINKCKPAFELNTPVFMIWEQRQYLLKMQVARPITSPCDYMYQNISIFPVLDANGKADRLCFLIYDVTDQAISKIQVQGLNAELKKISRIDGLTGLFNRRYWQERFDLEYKLTFRTQTPVSVLIMDIDHFKKVNDTYGHQAGDSVIKNIASVIKQATRETDISGRYGGEEFVVLLPETSAKNALTVAERIRKLAEKTVTHHDNLDIAVTVSIGISEFNQEFVNSTQWLESADGALYEAKNAGRNKTVIAKS